MGFGQFEFSEVHRRQSQIVMGFPMRRIHFHCGFERLDGFFASTQLKEGEAQRIQEFRVFRFRLKSATIGSDGPGVIARALIGHSSPEEGVGIEKFFPDLCDGVRSKGNEFRNVRGPVFGRETVQHNRRR